MEVGFQTTLLEVLQAGNKEHFSFFEALLRDNKGIGHAPLWSIYDYIHNEEAAWVWFQVDIEQKSSMQKLRYCRMLISEMSLLEDCIWDSLRDIIGFSGIGDVLLSKTYPHLPDDFVNACKEMQNQPGQQYAYFNAMCAESNKVGFSMLSHIEEAAKWVVSESVAEALKYEKNVKHIKDEYKINGDGSSSTIDDRLNYKPHEVRNILLSMVAQNHILESDVDKLLNCIVSPKAITLPPEEKINWVGQQAELAALFMKIYNPVRGTPWVKIRKAFNPPCSFIGGFSVTDNAIGYIEKFLPDYKERKIVAV